MKKHLGCDFELLVVKSLKSGLVDSEISEHIKACADCGETAKVMQFFKANLTGEPSPKNLPVAGFVWWKFKLREKQRHTEQVSRPILIAQAAAVSIITGTFFWLKQNNSPFISMISEALNKVISSMETIAPTFIAGIICFTFICAVLVLAMRRFILDK